MCCVRNFLYGAWWKKVLGVIYQVMSRVRSVQTSRMFEPIESSQNKRGRSLVLSHPAMRTLILSWLERKNLAMILLHRFATDRHESDRPNVIWWSLFDDSNWLRRKSQSEESPWTPTRQSSPNCFIQSKSPRIATPFLENMLLELRITASFVTTPINIEESPVARRIMKSVHFNSMLSSIAAYKCGM